MKIFVPIKIKKTGGTSSFANKLKKAANKQGHEISFTFTPNYDVLLIIVSCKWKYILHAKKNQKKIVHRLDGVYYPSTIAGWLYPLFNARMKIIHHFFADQTIYQSAYSKYCCNRFLGKRKNEKSNIIFNGVDTHHFTPKGNKKNIRDNDKQHIFITWSRFRRHDQIIPLIKAIKIYRKKFSNNAKLVILGDLTGKVQNIPKIYHNRSYIQFLGPINNNELPNYARSADVFIMTHQNPPCPNNVLEAMACGLPICGVNDGAMNEITKIGYNSELIKTTEDAFFSTRKLDLSTMAVNMDKMIQNASMYKTNSRNMACKQFDVDNMATAYLDNCQI